MYVFNHLGVIGLQEGPKSDTLPGPAECATRLNNTKNDLILNVYSNVYIALSILLLCTKTDVGIEQ